MRGIIIYPEMRRTGTAGVEIVSSQVDAVAVRRAALYWDRVDHPQSQAIYLGLSAAEQLLKDAGILTETRISDAVQTQDILLETPGRALLQHHMTEPGKWSLAQSSPDLIMPGQLAESTRTVEIELYEALPVPAGDVPIHDILQFKHHRADELLAFRAAMDALYERVISARDIPRAKDAAVLEVETRLRDVHRVVGESAMRRIVSSLKVELSIKDLVVSGALMSHPMTAMAGVAAAAIKVGPAIAAGFKNPVPGLRDYAYLGYAANEIAAAPSGTPKNRGVVVTTNEGRVTASAASKTSPGRNDPCFCGSGIKFKKCHGAPSASR